MKTPVYLDHNAATPLDPRVLEAMLHVFKEAYGNPSSSEHPFGWYAQELVQIAREEVASLINARPEEIIFTSGATEANNLALKGAAGNRAPGRALVSAIEHKSVTNVLAAREIETEFLPVNEQGYVSPADVVCSLKRSAALLLSVIAANNEIGTVQKLEEIFAAARGKADYLHCDAAQAGGKIALDVRALNVDLLSLSAHKMHGPKGAGALYVRKGIKLEPLLHGGGQEDGVRSGTLNVPAIVGFGKACAIAKIEMKRDREHLAKLCRVLLDGLREQGVEFVLNGPPVGERLPGNLHLSFPGIDAAWLLASANTKIAFSTGAACDSTAEEHSHVLQAINLPEELQRSSIRLSFGRFSTTEEALFAAEVLAGLTVRRKSASM